MAKSNRKKAAKIKEPCRWLMRGSNRIEWVTEAKYTKAHLLEVFLAKPVRPMTAAEAKAYNRARSLRTTAGTSEHG